MLAGGELEECPMQTTVRAHRPRYHEAPARLDGRIQAMAVMAQRALEDAMDALERGDVLASDRVVAEDDAIDSLYQDIERAAIDVMARPASVASELRFLVALLHVALHLERIGDLAVEVAAATTEAADLATRPEIAYRLGEMGTAAAAMTEEAVTAFVRRDLATCEAVAARGVEVHRLDRQLLVAVIAAGDEDLPWALEALQIGRELERASDHAVDIAEQAWFLVTGELRELA
jgi:phosphate transport system protein